jgi:hypothetical protein
VTILATDSEGATSSVTFDLNVAAPNSSPSLATDVATVTVSEGQTAGNTGTWSDPDGDAVSLTASVGAVAQNANGTWSWSFATGNGPAESQTVTLVATDSHGAQSTVTFDLVVNNVPPVFASLSSDHPTLAQRSFDGNVTIAGAYLDVSSDTHTVTVNWGDGTPVQTLSTVDQLNDAFSAGHHYTQAGVFTITVTITDSDGAAVSQTTSAVVAGVSLVNGTLVVIGSPNQDNILIDVVKAGKGVPAQLRVKIGGDFYYFTLSEVKQIVIGIDANDHVNIQKDVPASVAWLT